MSSVSSLTSWHVWWCNDISDVTLSRILDITDISDMWYQSYLWVLLLLLKNGGTARLRDSDIRPMSLKTPAPQYQPIDRKKIKGKRVEDYSRDRVA